MDVVLQWILMGLGVIGISVVIGKRINVWVSGLFAGFRIFINQAIQSIAKDPEMRKLAYSAILYVQKSFADLSGEGRLQKAIEFMQSIIPGKFDNETIRMVIQNLYDELLKPVQEVR